MNKRATTKYFAASIYLAVVVWAAFGALRGGFGDYFAAAAKREKSIETAEKARRFDPENPEILKLKGVLQSDAGDYDAAVESLAEGAKLRKNDFHVFLRLGYAFSKKGEFEAARENYLRALDLAPNYAQPRRYLGRLLLKTQNYDEAFAFLRQSAELDSENYPETLRLGRRYFPADFDALEQATASGAPALKKEQARYFIKHRIFTENLREFLEGNQLTEKERNLFIKRLGELQEYHLANEIWRTARGFDEKDFLIDGGFERGAINDQSGFGWQFDAANQNVELGIDYADKHTEKQSLTMNFKGETKLNTPILAQIAVLKENAPFRLEFAFLADNLVSAANPSIVVSDAEFSEIVARYELKNSATKSWQKVSLDFRAPASGVALISVVRESCQMSPCPIFGQIGLDSFQVR